MDDFEKCEHCGEPLPDDPAYGLFCDERCKDDFNAEWRLEHSFDAKGA